MRIVVSVLEEVDVDVRDVAPASSSAPPNPPALSRRSEDPPHRRDGGVLTYCGDQLVPAAPFGLTHAICSRCGQTMRAVWG